MKGNKGYCELCMGQISQQWIRSQAEASACLWWWCWNRCCRAVRKYWKPEEENEEIFNSYGGKSQEMPANTERSISTIQQLKKVNRDVQEKVKENSEAGLPATALKTVELSWNTWRPAMMSYHFSVTRVKQLEHHSQKLAEKHETSLTKVTQPDGNNHPLKYSQRTSLKN